MVATQLCESVTAVTIGIFSAKLSSAERQPRIGFCVSVFDSLCFYAWELRLSRLEVKRAGREQSRSSRLRS